MGWSVFVSLVFHVSLIITLSLLVAFMPPVRQLMVVVSTEPGELASPDESSPPEVLIPDVRRAVGDESLARIPAESRLRVPTIDTAEPTIKPYRPRRSAPIPSPDQLLVRRRAIGGGGFQGRDPSRRGEFIGPGGGTGLSEDAVALALAWLVAHQRADGGWRLAFDEAPCNGQCRNSGNVGTTTGATGLALLPFLGAGHTHLKGEYRDVVHQGIYYLKSRMIMTPNGGDLQEGTMYAQGIATIALCEAFAMTEDESLRLPAQARSISSAMLNTPKAAGAIFPTTPATPPFLAGR